MCLEAERRGTSVGERKGGRGMVKYRRKERKSHGTRKRVQGQGNNDQDRGGKKTMQGLEKDCTGLKMVNRSIE